VEATGAKGGCEKDRRTRERQRLCWSASCSPRESGEGCQCTGCEEGREELSFCSQVPHRSWEKGSLRGHEFRGQEEEAWLARGGDDERVSQLRI